MYYKYRSLSNLQFALDILVNKRLYASEFTKLNDPMEGLFTYNEGAIQQWIVDAIYSQKMTYKILSLCEEPDNMLMWSYYTEGHRGMVLGVELADKTIKVESMKYVVDFNINNINQEDVAKVILCKKHISWQHEKEHRVFIQGASFVDVKIHKLIFGVEAENETTKLITLIAKKFNPRIAISLMTKDTLNKGTGRYRA